MKPRSRQIIFGLVILLLISLGTVWFLERREQPTVDLPEQPSEPITLEPDEPPSEVFPLVSLSTSEKVPQLKELAANGNVLDQNRARYLLAVIALEQQNPDQALQWLNELEQGYSRLSDQILLQRAKAYELKGETATAQDIWRDITSGDRHRAVIAEATYHLGKYNAQQWEYLIREFPEHPRTHEVIRNKLEANPDQLDLLRILAQYHPEAEGMTQQRDRMVDEYEEELTSKDWQIIADGYWATNEFEAAAEAYANAPKTPKNLYRQGRGLQVNDETSQAQSVYQELVDRFPDAEQTGLALRRIAEMVSDEQALSYLDQAIENFPKQAPTALTHKATRLENQGETEAAEKARNRLLQDYSTSDAAAQYRWEMAQAQAQQGHFSGAIQWANVLIEENSRHSNAAKASFWKGKWFQQQGNQQAAQTNFQQTLSQYSYSYYAWRSAVYLDLPVGDFTTVRQLNPEVEKPRSRPFLPAGSQTLRELHRLGQDQMAWQLWQSETSNQDSLSVAEQFTDGVLHITQQQYLKGINQISSLRERDNPEEVSQWQKLRQKPMYWHHLFPFPYYETIRKWSQQRNLNPLLTISLIRQESRFEKDIGSVAGAQGLMQLIPTTADWVAQEVNLQDYSLKDPEDNINLGTWYLAHNHRRHDNNAMLAMASYNAGYGNVMEWVDRYSKQDSDAFVQQIPFPETKNYIETVFGNYWNYLRLYNPKIQKRIED